MTDRFKGHTPGPWVIFQDPGKPYAILPAMRPGTICRFTDSCINTDANAELLRCAPELLAENERLKAVNAELVEACEKAYDWSLYAGASRLKNTPEFLRGLMEDGESVQNRLTAAIAKAKEGSNLFQEENHGGK